MGDEVENYRSHILEIAGKEKYALADLMNLTPEQFEWEYEDGFFKMVQGPDDLPPFLARDAERKYDGLNRVIQGIDTIPYFFHKRLQLHAGGTSSTRIHTDMYLHFLREYERYGCPEFVFMFLDDRTYAVYIDHEADDEDYDTSFRVIDRHGIGYELVVSAEDTVGWEDGKPFVRH